MFKNTFFFRGAVSGMMAVAIIVVAFGAAGMPVVRAQGEERMERAPLICPSGMKFGEVVQCSISAPAETDTYTFYANSGDIIIARMSRSSGDLTPELRVFDPAGLELCSDWDTVLSEIASCTLTESGTYSILAGDYGGTKTGDYYLYLQRLINPGNAPGIAFGETLAGSILAPAEMDTYGFKVSAGDKAVIRMSKSSGTLSPEIRIYSPAGILLCQDWDTVTSEIASCDLTSVGWHWILVGDYYGTETGDYYLSLQRLGISGDPVSISGNVEAADVTLKYHDGTAKSVLSDASGFYSITVPFGWSGRVTPAKKIGMARFYPTMRIYKEVSVNQTAQDYQPQYMLVAKSIALHDGWILESEENSNAGGTMNSTATLRLGDDAQRRQYRSILSFRIPSLPDNAAIRHVELQVRRQGVVGGGNVVSIFKPLVIDFRKGSFGTPALEVNDWQATGEYIRGYLFMTPVLNWYRFWMDESYVFNLVKGGGLIQLRLRFELDDNDDDIANYLSLFSGNARSDKRPYLIIEYTLP